MAASQPAAPCSAITSGRRGRKSVASAALGSATIMPPLVVAGTPEEVARTEGSATGEYLDRVLRGEPLLAFYDPPWTLPFFRRNEILFEIAGP